ncbi:MAG: 4,5-dioxygenase [Bdellovibrionales bacterium CG12_big_fil_rev_8_21_14_0_65_38_15]|nr:MAG: 4,5-dioxygenase [Bdellovibrionales bacterium CG22_combo_CG10-13_8_21_14_all_38_13]PIQ56267.1 MAG: 4,5-dioxygenase [Bdellovibrionales bacterium CG12_big_fil_rev_8_21_14_0_65_38_15]PIR30411.1 MAG: 4,5-dioxygenase [Bdellovibrionales bacterium CG11_big_fil_rev_8_21_14_0_20_38_13]
MIFSSYHFHLYFSSHQMEIANALAAQIAEEFQLQVGRVWDRPVGPHPINSCQITVPYEKFESLASWLLVHRQGLDIFIHPEGEDDLVDHRDHIMWIGRSYDLKLDIFKK